MTDIKKVKRFFEQEIRSLELAPKINGCEMTEDWKEQIEICKMSISALEKQIPKKPSETEKARCIHCGCVVKQYERFCHNCGQSLDWGDTE